jgi:4-amino-4-deoxy-L-arabinose transferase-like glycosyltransferase
MARFKPLACVGSAEGGRRLSGPDSAVVIIIIVTSTALVGMGTPISVALGAVAGAGLLSVCVIRLSVRRDWRQAKALLALAVRASSA